MPVGGRTMTTVRSASAVIHDGRGRVLLGKRSSMKRLSPGAWETIGGVRLQGETAEDCVRREVREELGCEVTHLEPLGDYEWLGREVRLVAAVFVAKIAGRPVSTPEAHETVQWFSRSQALRKRFAVDCRRRVADFFASARSR